MHNALNRVQNVFGLFTSVASVVALAIALVSLVSMPVPGLKDGALQLRNVQVVKGRPHYYSQKKEEYAHIKFDLDIDLSTLFTYNTKQIFLYITATYPADSTSPPSTPPSQATIWDAILPHPQAPSHPNTYIYPSSSTKKTTSKSKSKKTVQPKVPGILKLDNQRPKYQITDPTGRLANRGNATLELHYNIQPWVGALTWGRPTTSIPIGSTKAVGGVPRYDIFSRLISSFTQRTIANGAKSDSFKLPKLKEKAATGENLGTAKGAEGNRGKPA